MGQLPSRGSVAAGLQNDPAKFADEARRSISPLDWNDLSEQSRNWGHLCVGQAAHYLPMTTPHQLTAMFWRFRGGDISAS